MRNGEGGGGVVWGERGRMSRVTVETDWRATAAPAGGQSGWLSQHYTQALAPVGRDHADQLVLTFGRIFKIFHLCSDNGQRKLKRNFKEVVIEMSSFQYRVISQKC